MKLHQSHETTSTIPRNGREFSITASPKAFQLLADNIYTHKIAAVVREISANAYDAHKMSGKSDVSFEITLPTYLDPHFIVEDFGTGLTQDEVFDIYCNLFASTKTDSNDPIGCFGLGSKSVFSVSKTVSLVSRKDGTETYYIVTMPDNEAPRCDIMYEKPTTEQNGFKVIVPIRESAFSEVRSECEFYLSFYDVRPIINADYFTFVLTEEEILELKNKGYLVTDTQLPYSCSMRSVKNIVVMGPVPYASSFDVSFETSKFFQETVKASWKTDKKLFIYANVGDLQVSTSREALSNDQLTKDAFEQKIKQVDKRLNEELDEICNSGTLPEICRKLATMGIPIGLTKLANRANQMMTLGKYGLHPFDAKKSVTPSRNNIFSLKEIVIVNKDTKRALRKKYIKDFYRDESIMYTSSEHLSEHRMNRLNTLLGGHVRFISYKDAYDHAIANRKSPVKRVKGHTKKEANSVYCKAVQLLPSAVAIPQRHFNLDDENVTYVYGDITDNSWGLKVNHYDYRVIQKCLTHLGADCDELIVIPNNSRTKKKIEQNSILSVVEYVSQYATESTVTRILEQSFFIGLSDRLMPDTIKALIECSAVQDALDKSEVDFVLDLKEKINLLDPNVDETASFIITNLFDAWKIPYSKYDGEVIKQDLELIIFNLVQSEMITNKSGFHYVAGNALIKRYPMLKYLSPYEFTSDSLVDIIDYIKQIDNK